MYSGTTLTKISGRVMGAHQKIDRVARRHLALIVGSSNIFPSIGKILQFEGKNGPDGIKRKSPAKDEPWHYYSPFNNDDSQLIELIQDHYRLLVQQLKLNNKERVAFEAAWLAHAIVDGLTPAHHYPYEKELEELRGEGLETRTTLKGKLLIPGDTKRKQVKNNWKMWGPKGLITTHGLFEFGIASIIKPLGFSDATPTKEELQKIKEIGIVEWFKRSAREIAVLDMYNRYHHRGWSTRLTLDVRQKLAPNIIKTVTLAWYSAMAEAGLIEQS
ncbi:MAG TPA: hypothetical protein VLF90_03215 [Patescibacteria group bacterium]|nr:hypothetical protein [Patescibacteria group bacterium]